MTFDEAIEAAKSSYENATASARYNSSGNAEILTNIGNGYVAIAQAICMRQAVKVLE